MESVTVKEYVQIYPLEHFPLLKEFCDNLHLYSKDKNEFWELFVEHSLKCGLRVICRLLFKNDNDEQVYEAFFTMMHSPLCDWYYLGLSYKNTEKDIMKMLEEYSDSIFSIDDWDKDSIQRFLIEELLEHTDC